MVVQFLWPCCVLFPLFDSKLSPMAYSLTFNLLALLCTPPSRGRTSCGLLPVFCLLFRFVLQGLIIKTSFLDIFVCLVERVGCLLWSVGLLWHFHVTAQPCCCGSGGDRGYCPGCFSLCGSQPDCFGSSLFLLRTRCSSIDNRFWPEDSSADGYKIKFFRPQFDQIGRAHV